MMMKVAMGARGRTKVRDAEIPGWIWASRPEKRWSMPFHDHDAETVPRFWASRRRYPGRRVEPGR